MDETLVGRAVHALARYTALAGGAALVVVMIVTVISIIGRMMIPLGLSAIPGDFEIVQAGMVFAVFAFMPWCHLARGNAIVAVLTDRFPIRFNAMLEFLWDVVMFLIAAFIAWRLYFGMLDKIAYRDSTFILRIPVWMTYAGGMIGACILIIIAAYCVVRSGSNAFSRNPARPLGGSAE